MKNELFRSAIRPLASAVGISGDLLADSPEVNFGKRRIWTSDYGLLIGTLIDADGPTTLIVSFVPPECELECAFDGSLLVSDERKIEIADGFLSVTYLLLGTQENCLNLAVFTNHPTEPDYIHIHLKTFVKVEEIIADA
ncbi:hypothetical protein [Aquidulcibacter sp.]|uniref:hypothetical protein n=1 Tax=Aquidulcibacter sp. TaxID=2052990 RepID=UPI0025BB36CB|nr:hypothetical protein [Aquidulcibacter sp.]MCA3697460.1 hypothetical protein [Aquidulcibacter sp.]